MFKQRQDFHMKWMLCCTKQQKWISVQKGYVLLLLDERHIRENIVYDKHSSWPSDQLCQPWRGQQTPRFTQPGCSEIQWELFKKVLKNQSPGKETNQVVYSQYPDFICYVVIPIIIVGEFESKFAVVISFPHLQQKPCYCTWFGVCLTVCSFPWHSFMLQSSLESCCMTHFGRQS